LKGCDPDRRTRGEHNDRDAPALEAARAAPHERVGGADQRIGAADRPSVWQAAGRDKQRRAGGTSQVSGAPQRQRRSVAVLQEGEQQQQAADHGDKERHREQRRQVENEMGSSDRRHFVPRRAPRADVRVITSSVLRSHCRYA
jgi:hypothetical protein